MHVQALPNCCSLAYLSETGNITDYTKKDIGRKVRQLLRNQGDHEHANSIKAVMFITNKGFFYRLGLRLKYGCYRGIRYRGFPVVSTLGLTHSAYCMIMPLVLSKY